MLELSVLLEQRDKIISKINEIEENFEGIDNPNVAQKITALNVEQSKLVSEKNNVESKKVSIESKLNQVSEEIRNFSSDGVTKILEAIGKQRWYFFKNKTEVLMDRDTGLLWPNLDYFNVCEDENSNYISIKEANMSVSRLELNGFIGWGIPNRKQFIKMIGDKSFPFQSSLEHRRNNRRDWYVMENDLLVTIDLESYHTNISPGYLIPIYQKLVSSNYQKDIALDNKLFTQTEKHQMTLNIFINNNLEPIFDDEEITIMYRKMYIEKPALLENLSQLQEQIQNSQQVELLSSKLDYKSILLNYDVKAVNSSVIKYYESVISMIDTFMEQLHHFEDVKNETIQDFNMIGLKLSKKYEDNPNLTVEENQTLGQRQQFFKKHFELGMNTVNRKLLSVKRQSEEIEERIEEINNGDNSIRELAIIEKENRASFEFIVENVTNIMKKALLRIEFFEENKSFASNVISLWDKWSENYKVFKTTMKDDLKNTCEDDSIENETYSSWYVDWQKKRIMIEEKFLPLIEYGLKGNLIHTSEEETIIEKALESLWQYKEGIDEFYLEERKNIHQKYAFQVGGDLQEKFESEMKLYKLVSRLQLQLQDIIFSLDKAEDRLFLLKWAESLINLQIDDVLEFINDKELSMISQSVLTEFADLKRKNFEVYISDSKAYSEELQNREKEYNALIYKMRKDLMNK